MFKTVNCKLNSCINDRRNHAHEIYAYYLYLCRLVLKELYHIEDFNVWRLDTHGRIIYQNKVREFQIKHAA